MAEEHCSKEFLPIPRVRKRSKDVVVQIPSADAEVIANGSADSVGGVAMQPCIGQNQTSMQLSSKVRAELEVHSSTIEHIGDHAPKSRKKKKRPPKAMQYGLPRQSTSAQSTARRMKQEIINQNSQCSQSVGIIKSTQNRQQPRIQQHRLINKQPPNRLALHPTPVQFGGLEFFKEKDPHVPYRGKVCGPRWGKDANY
jgi:hypothetical protein